MLAEQSKQPIDEQLTEINAKVADLKAKFDQSEHYKNVSFCVIYHENVLRWNFRSAFNEFPEWFSFPAFAMRFRIFSKDRFLLS